MCSSCSKLTSKVDAALLANKGIDHVKELLGECRADERKCRGGTGGARELLGESVIVREEERVILHHDVWR
jgi:hypothetical protein